MPKRPASDEYDEEARAARQRLLEESALPTTPKATRRALDDSRLAQERFVAYMRRIRSGVSPDDVALLERKDRLFDGYAAWRRRVRSEAQDFAEFFVQCGE